MDLKMSSFDPTIQYVRPTVYYNLIEKIQSFSDIKYNNELYETYAADQDTINDAIFTLNSIINYVNLPDIELFGDGSIFFIWKNQNILANMRFIGNKKVSYYLKQLDTKKSFSRTVSILDKPNIIFFLDSVNSFFC
jgi:hypothetical protein